jgi:hypothetical protein
MSLGHRQGIIAAVGALALVILLLFPEWYAVHPVDAALNIPLGFSWILSPPSAPEHFGNMAVERSHLIFILVAVVAGAIAGVYWLLDAFKRR